MQELYRLGRAAGLGRGEFSASAVDQILRGTGVEKLEAIAERGSMANQSVDVHFAKRKGKAQAHNLIDADFHPQYRRDSRFAEIGGTAADYGATAAMNCDFGIELESRMASEVFKFIRLTGFQLNVLRTAILLQQRY